jgi:hypothetical protein
VLLEGGNNEFLELEEITKRLSSSSTHEKSPGGKDDVSKLEAITEMFIRSNTHEESPITIKLSLLTPLPDEST